MYENGKMRPVETIPGMGEGHKGEWWRGDNSTMIYCKRRHLFSSLFWKLKVQEAQP
jgi:hypothetical protein